MQVREREREREREDWRGKIREWEGERRYKDGCARGMGGACLVGKGGN